MAVSLTQALETKGLIDFNQIGREAYLSYDSVQGWDVVQLDGIFGCFQRMRRALGLYSATSLQTVAAQIVREENVPRALMDKITQSWRRRFPDILPVGGHALFNGCTKMFGDTQISIEKRNIILADVEAIVSASDPDPFRVHIPIEGTAIIRLNDRVGTVQWVVSTAGPDLTKNPNHPAEALRDAYISSLQVAHEQGVRSIAFPPISTDKYAYPFDEAVGIGLDTIQQYVQDHPDQFDVIKMVFSKQDDIEGAGRIFIR